MKTLLLVSALLQPAPAPSAPALYSFDDVYRLTVGGAAMADFPAAAGAMRVAVSPETRPQTQAGAAEAAYSVREVQVPQPWLLVFAGLAAAFWVARRRLANGY